jgi:hypothetical protein
MKTCTILSTGTVATGEGAFRPGRDLFSTKVDSPTTDASDHEDNVGDDSLEEQSLQEATMVTGTFFMNVIVLNNFALA